MDDPGSRHRKAKQHIQRILIIGASSGIARAIAREYASRHCELFLIARAEESLREQAEDLRIRGAASVNYALLDVNHFDRHQEVIAQAAAALGHLDLALICHGTLPDQNECQDDFGRIQQEFNTNALSVLSLLAQLTPLLRAQRSGVLGVITSVAGNRGRQSNYLYGAAKSAVSRYLEGLRGNLHADNVHVIDIRPGFVDTSMTRHLPKGALWASPETVARAIVRGIESRRNTLYVPWFWRGIMLVVAGIPETIFKRLKF
jgi:decaprenylphospho-beta-D-erythro-pentofuranosid-2-ulose 2-reductase